MARSLNKVELIGNLTRDPELRYTPQGTAVCTFGLATNRQWVVESGEKKEDVEFHRIVVWNKLAELCAQLLSKGRKIYVEGRLQTRKWTTQDGQDRTITEIVINDMIILDSRGQVVHDNEFNVPEDNIDEVPVSDDAQGSSPSAKVSSVKKVEDKSEMKKKVEEKEKDKDEEDKEASEDIPF